MTLTRLAAAFLLFVAPLSLAQTNARPLVYPSLSPISTPPSSPAFTLTVNGTGFVTGSQVEWNNSPRTTTFISSHSLQAAITAGDVATAGTALVTVLNPAPGGGISNTVYFTIAESELSVSVAVESIAVAPPGGNAIVVGDFNGDGILDILAGLSTTKSQPALGFYQGNGNGTFQPPVLSKTAYGVSNFLVGDLNGDGKPDLIIETPIQFGEGVQVLLNNGDGTFTQGQFPRGGTPIALGDFNGDGALDAIAVSCDQGFCNLVYMRGNGKGGFHNYHYIDENQDIGGNVAVGDFNNDGKLDFVDSEGYLFLGNGDGTFESPITIPNLSGYTISAAADLNGDGNLDFVAISQDNALCIALGDGAGSFNISCGSTYSYNSTVFIGDFNGDGKLDLALNGNASTLPYNSQIEILPGNGDGTFGTPLATGNNTIASSFGDFNSDGRLDFANLTSAGLAISLQSPAALSPFSLSYASYEVGQTSPPQIVTLTNNGTAPIKVAGITFGGSDPADFAYTSHCGSPIQGGSSCNISVVFKPLVFGYQSASLVVTYAGTIAESQSVQLTGTGLTTTDVFTPNSLAFNFQTVGTASAPMTTTLENTGPQPLTIDSLTITGPFTYTTNCGTILAVNASCNVFVVFAPITGSGASGVLTANTSAQNGPVTVGLSGTGTELIVSPLSLNFGNQAVGTTSAPMIVTLTNASHNTMLHLLPLAIVGNNRTDFAQTDNCPTKLGPSASCTAMVTFTPTAVGARSAQLNTDGYYGLQPVALSGTGTE